MEDDTVTKAPEKNSLASRIEAGRTRNSARTSVREVVEDHPVAAIAAGILLGALAAKLLPRLGLGKLGSRAVTLATVGAEVAALYGSKMAEAAAEATSEGREKLGELGESIGETAGEARRRSVDLADLALTGAKAFGGKTLRQASEIASRLRH